MPPERAKPGCQHCRALPSRRPRGRWPAGQLKLCPLSAPRRLIARPCPPTALQEEGPGRSVGPPASHRGSLEGQGAQAHPTPSRGLESRGLGPRVNFPRPGMDPDSAWGGGCAPRGPSSDSILMLIKSVSHSIRPTGSHPRLSHWIPSADVCDLVGPVHWAFVCRLDTDANITADDIPGSAREGQPGVSFVSPSQRGARQSGRAG